MRQFVMFRKKSDHLVVKLSAKNWRMTIAVIRRARQLLKGAPV